MQPFASSLFTPNRESTQVPPWPSRETLLKPSPPAVEAFFLDRLPLARCLDLQRRLLGQIGGRDDGQIALLLCEHPEIITVGRGGSQGDIRRESPTIKNREIEILYVNRGGGCLLHCPGQLAIYPLVPLAWHGFSVGSFCAVCNGV